VRSRARACARAWLAGAIAVLQTAIASAAAREAPDGLDCAALPCAEVLPAATAFARAGDGPQWEGRDASGELAGWVALSTDFVDVKAYSGKPLVTLVGLGKDGVIRGARVVHHSEPILLVGIPEQALSDFVDFYAGKSARARIVVGRASAADTLSVDAISGATVTALAQNSTVLDSARALGVAVGIFEATAVSSGHFVAEERAWTFDELLAKKALARLRVSEREMGAEGAGDEAHVDLVFGIADAPQVGRALLGDAVYAYQLAQLVPGEHLLVVANAAPGSFKGSAFVRGGIFDRVRLQQGLQEITFRDADYDNLPELAAEGAPELTEGALFVVRGGRFDPGKPYELVFLGSRYDRRGAFSREFREFTASHELPRSVYVVDATGGGIPWRQAWRNRASEVGLLIAYLVFVLWVFVARGTTTATPARIRWLHRASLAIGFLGLGVGLRAQPSVTQVLTFFDSLVRELRWDLFLSEPFLFVLWTFTFVASLVWGRGVFCGWVCPYGAMTELAYKVAGALGVPRYELPDRVHVVLRNARYVVFAGLVAAFAWSTTLGEQLAEVEPFKSTFLVPAWTRAPGFLAWWLVLLAASLFTYRPFCRYLCPLGGGLALLSSFRPLGPRRRVFCSGCKICARGCEPRAFRADGSIDPRECLSCLDCEATYRNRAVCPPLLAIDRLEVRADSLDERERAKLAALRAEAADL